MRERQQNHRVVLPGRGLPGVRASTWTILMIKTLFMASTALLMTGVAAPALAQSAPDWSGPYIGIYGGYAENKSEDDQRLVFDRDFDGQFDDTVVLNGTTNDAFSPGYCQGRALGPAAADGCSDRSGGPQAGLVAGYDLQFGNIVVGAVADISALDSQRTVTGFSTTPANYAFTQELQEMAAIRARVGIAAGPALIYATGGAAYANVENRFSTTNTANSFVEQSNEDNMDGWQAGAGLEWRLAPNLSVTGEYLYTSLDGDGQVVRAGNTGTTPATNPFILAPNTGGTDIATTFDSYDTHAVRIGMNVRF
jgi:outer membrane immunogenic protein